ncbi:MAG TPA: MBL fold metallo-hydrolase [Verrucomicrobiota bacterium]|nr:MBL fold metallo-hydrolase [Verrucomicrobiota bacterium]HRR63244.1 MBL fold metallo-hydrolase [Candidatus Paceibacterota bacterium]HOF71757.1 MBL fold metallo-hydrolase [Verrucomicrobiota bacterium]HOM44937.1 MBL fold metallo-hydrolase [Verrucomicrobiota bacterium]HOQ56782.1 MBL fold metallo-hydrolase [Verrucomicrobiota bacterium]
MRILNLNPDCGIGASAWFVDLEGHRLLLDAGLHPRREGRAALPRYELIQREELDAIAISHSHHDHVGSLPVAQRYFPQAHILTTELSYFLIERMLHNSVNVMKRQRDELGLKEYPLYHHDEVDELAPRIQGFKYNREVDWAAFRKTRAGFISPTLEFFDAGHTLGSAGIRVCGRKETLFYTGDVCFHDQTILRGARFAGVKADVLIMETTRGNRPLSPGFTRDAEVERLSQAILRVLRRRGSILIPAFAMGRTQEILALLALLTRQGRLKPQPIYIGGLGRVFTEIYDLEAHRAHRQYPNLQLRDALNLVVLGQEQVENLKLAGSRIFVITSGMMSEHTASCHLARRLFADEKHAIFFVGYADPDTPGGRLKASLPGEPFLFSPLTGQVRRQCEVEDFSLTAHASREDLLDFVCEVEPRAVLLTHGEADSIQWFADQIRARLPRSKVIVPQPGETVEV